MSFLFKFPSLKLIFFRKFEYFQYFKQNLFKSVVKPHCMICMVKILSPNLPALKILVENLNLLFYIYHDMKDRYSIVAFVRHIFSGTQIPHLSDCIFL